jgi:hypothetical protein
MDLRCRGRPGAFAEIEIFAGLCVYVSNRHSYASRFDLAYNVAHALVLAALRQAGYRSDNRYLVFQTLSHTIGMEAARWRVLARRTRGAIWPSTRSISNKTTGCWPN